MDNDTRAKRLIRQALAYDELIDIANLLTRRPNIIVSAALAQRLNAVKETVEGPRPKQWSLVLSDDSLRYVKYKIESLAGAFDRIHYPFEFIVKGGLYRLHEFGPIDILENGNGEDLRDFIRKCEEFNMARIMAEGIGRAHEELILGTYNDMPEV